MESAIVWGGAVKDFAREAIRSGITININTDHVHVKNARLLCYALKPPKVISI